MKKVSRNLIGIAIVSVVSLGVSLHCESSADSLVKLLPEGGKLNGWKRDGEHLSYYAENLWEYINGSAENFLTYDFKEVIVQDYKNKSGQALKVEIYRHGSPLMAFGIYSQYRAPDLTFYDIGNEGFGDDYSLHFWKGDCYVKISVFEKGEEMAGEMKAFADAVAAGIEEAGSIPDELVCFPEAGLVEKSITYVTEGVLGSGRLPPAFTAEYKWGDGVVKLYLFTFNDADGARGTFDWYAEEIGAKIEDGITGKVKYSRGACNHPYRGNMLVFHYGRRMGVLTGFEETPDAGEDLLVKAVERIAGDCERIKN